MYVLIKKTYIWSWKIHTYGLKNMVLDIYVRSTYDLKNMPRWWGWTATDRCWWTDVSGWISVDGRGQMNGRWSTSDKIVTEVTLMKLWQTTMDGDSDGWQLRWTATMIDDNGDGRWLWRTTTTTNGNCNGQRLQRTMIATDDDCNGQWL
jgi:hypothetical protein